MLLSREKIALTQLLIRQEAFFFLSFFSEPVNLDERKNVEKIGMAYFVVFFGVFFVPWSGRLMLFLVDHDVAPA